jgi:glycerophosphoryl diester phosphodiesterase
LTPLSPLLKRPIERQSTSRIWPPLKIGHRGAAGEAPENTLASFDLALSQGADGIEFDVQLSSDAIPVVIHDARLTRTTSGSGWVHEHRASTLRRLDAGSWFNRRHRSRARERYAGARIPLLVELLHWVKATQCLAFIEIKDFRPGATPRILQEIDKAGIWHLVRIFSFDLTTLEQVKELKHGARLGLDFSGRLMPLRRALALGAEAVVPHWSIASKRLIRKAHREGLKVFPWTVNYPLHMKRKIQDGVDGIITNYPARLTRVMNQIFELQS